MPRRLGVTGGVPQHLGHRRGRLVGRREGHEPFPAAEGPAGQARVLGDHRPPGGEVTGAAVRDPSATGADVELLGHEELGRRARDVGLVGAGVPGDAAGIGQPPAPLGQEGAIGPVVVVDVEGQLEADAGNLSGQAREPAELVHPQAVGHAVADQGAERSPPAADAGQPAGVRPGGRIAGRPGGEVDGRERRDPVDAAGGHGASGSAEVLADGHEGVVPGEGVVEAELPPQLREAGVDVDEDTPVGAGEQDVVVEVAHDVEQHGAVGPPLEVGAVEAEAAAAAVEEEGVAAVHPRSGHHALEPAPLPRVLRRGVGVGQHGRFEPVDEEDVGAGGGEPGQPVAEHPGVTADAGALRQSTGHDDGGPGGAPAGDVHAASRCGRWFASRKRRISAK